MGSSCRSTPTVASDESTSPTGSTRRRSFLPSSSSTFPSRTRASSSTSRCRCSSSATTTRWVKWRRLAMDNRVENPIWSHFVEKIFTFRRMIKTHQIILPDSVEIRPCVDSLLIQTFLMSFQNLNWWALQDLLLVRNLSREFFSSWSLQVALRTFTVYTIEAFVKCRHIFIESKFALSSWNAKL